MTYLSPTARVLLPALPLLIGLCSCTYDFDAPFTGSRFGTSPEDGGNGNVDSGIGGGGAGGSAGSSGGSSNAGNGGSAGGDAQIPCAWQVPSPPDGWHIGFILPNEASSSCSGQTKTFAEQGMSYYDAPPAVGKTTCTCQCGTPVAGSCEIDRAKLYPQQGCGGFSGFSVHHSDCKNRTPAVNLASTSAVLLSKSIVSPSCSNASVAMDAPPVQWGTPVPGCMVPAEIQNAHDTLCLSDNGSPPNAVACLFRTGQQECPPDYPVAETSLYDGTVVDTRTCTGVPCQCIAQGNTHCEARLYAFSLTDCSANSPSHASVLVRDDQCTDLVSMSGFYAASISLAASGESMADSCILASGGAEPTPTGGVTPKGRVTVCCQAK